MTEQLLPPLTDAQRELLGLLYHGGSILSQTTWTHVADVNGKLDFSRAEPLKSTIAGLIRRKLIVARLVTDAERKRGAYTVAYEITPEGRAAHEALARRV